MGMRRQKYSSSGHERSPPDRQVSTRDLKDALLSKRNARGSALAGQVSPRGTAWQGDRKENAKYRLPVEKYCRVSEKSCRCFAAEISLNYRQNNRRELILAAGGASIGPARPGRAAVSPLRRRRGEAVHFPRKAGDAPGCRVELEHLAGHGAADFRLRDLQRAARRVGIAARDRLLNPLDERPDAAAAGAVDRGPLGRLSYPLLGGTVVRHRVLPCLRGFEASAIAPRRRAVNGRPSGRKPAQRLLNVGVRFSMKACMPSWRSSLANVA
jgi:hypothetical protein